MNYDRNDTEYSCGIISNTVSNPTVADIVDESDPTILYVAGEHQYSYTTAYVLSKSRDSNITCIPRSPFN